MGAERKRSAGQSAPPDGRRAAASKRQHGLLRVSRPWPHRRAATSDRGHAGQKGCLAVRRSCPFQDDQSDPAP